MALERLMALPRIQQKLEGRKAVGNFFRQAKLFNETMDEVRRLKVEDCKNIRTVLYETATEMHALREKNFVRIEKCAKKPSWINIVETGAMTTVGAFVANLALMGMIAIGGETGDIARSVYNSTGIAPADAMTYGMVGSFIAVVLGGIFVRALREVREKTLETAKKNISDIFGQMRDPI